MPLLLKFIILSAILIAASVGNTEGIDWEEWKGDVFAVIDSDMEGNEELSDGDRDLDVSHLRKEGHLKHYANESVAEVGRGRNASYRSKRMRKHDEEEDLEGNVYADTESDMKGDVGELRNGFDHLRNDYHSKHYANDSVAKIERRRKAMYRSKSVRKPDDEEDERVTKFFKRKKPDCDDEDRHISYDSKTKGKVGDDEEKKQDKNSKKKEKKKGEKDKNRKEKSGGSCQTCGKMSFGKPGKPTYRVINGRVIVPMYKYPWLVNLHHPKYWLRCGGTLISATYVLTAAQCVLNLKKFESSKECKSKGVLPKTCFFKPNEITVGLLRRQWQKEPRRVQIAKIIPHEKFAFSTMLHDVALIKLAEPVPCNELSSPVCLPRSDLKKKMGERLIVAGWGHRSKAFEGEKVRRVLREGMMTQIKAKICKKILHLNITDMICAIGTETKQSSCVVGERGTSIFTPFGNKFYSLGVLTDSFECRIADPAAYTKVYPYIDWIKSHVKDLPKPQG